MRWGLIIIFYMISAMAWASDRTDANWTELLKTNNLNKEDQAYCFVGENQGEDYEVEGQNIFARVRLASVSKLVTTLWAIDALGANYKYKTKLSIKGSHLHIAGSLDPFMGNEKMFFLLSQLNDLGFDKFTTITFDKNLIVFPNAQGYIEEYPEINTETITKNLMTYFNTATWSEGLKNLYTKTAQHSGNRLRANIHFEVNEIKNEDRFPFQSDDDIRVLTLSSPPLFRYLKEVNVESNNFVAHTLFLQLGAEKEFERYMLERFHYSDEVIHFYSGSGLPVFKNQKRYDNYATCSAMLTFIAALKEKAQEEGRELEDLMAVPGSDAGTFKNRIFPADYKNAFVAKSGTLFHTSTLAGAMSTKNGFNFYGIFNQTTNLEGAKSTQNAMVISIMTEMQGPLAFDYTVKDFDPYGEAIGTNSNFSYYGNTQ